MQRKSINSIPKLDSNKLYEVLKYKLLNLEYIPGEMISENEIVKDYEVSRSIIRPAFTRLIIDKLLEVYPQRGSFVTLLDIEEIKNLAYIRTLIEYDVLNNVLENCDETLLDNLKKGLNAQKQLISNDSININDFFEIDTGFHELYYGFDGKLDLWHMIGEAQISYTRFRILSLLVLKNYEDLYTEHYNIYTALKNKDKDELKESIYNHINIRLDSFSKDGIFKEYFKL